ncbi:MAG: cobalamin B12-binding domain-containing protein [Deltaproteobacteria bacterium]|nr:cobalamin B12-binding domain-containing protein [Deltaproteobacteria bacterium]
MASASSPSATSKSRNPPAARFSKDKPPRVLLAGVFKPYGIDDAFGRRENVMELFHNQVTRAQGIASMRFQHRSFGLYFIAANIDAPTTVLDFPTLEEFIRELKRGYDVVGISFITPNFVKAREMARLVRLQLPSARIVLGGHGAAIEGVESLIECDHVAKGEGIRWMRAFLGEDTDGPIHHPNLVSAENKHIYGVPTPGRTGLLVTGVGCVNGCRFCATSHNFGRDYTPFLKTGKEIFEAACRMEDEYHCSDFFVMDENFLKDGRRARELVEEMERANRFFQFAIFSSAETIRAFGIDNIVRLGVFWLWMGVESKKEIYEKNRDIDVAAMVAELQDHGIAVLASGILFIEEHTPENIEEDIDYLISLSPSFIQFMQVIPFPVTPIYEDFKRKGWLDPSIPFEEFHGQKRLAWRHPNFTPEQTETWLGKAFRKEFDVLGGGPMRMTRAHLNGVKRLKRMARTPTVVAREKVLLERVRELRLLVPVMARYAHDARESELIASLKQDLDRELGAYTMRERVFVAATFAFAAKYALQLGWKGDRTQPPTHRTEYRTPARRKRGWSAMLRHVPRPKTLLHAVLPKSTI